MNERIRELAAEAGLQPFEDCGPGYVYKMEKFAELIVRECVENIELFDHHINPASEVVPTMVYQVKQHFGVE